MSVRYSSNMPSRNTRKIMVPESYYHVYARGASKQPIFLDDNDHAVFFNLLKRYLSKTPAKDRLGREYPNYYGIVELLSFCLMKNHFHLLFYQEDEVAIQKVMQSVLTSYVTYFNHRHKRTGPLFESRYKASRITNDAYLLHISRYIHLNPKQWRTHKWSSLPYYLDGKEADWVRPRRVLSLHRTTGEYRRFVEDYQSHKATLDLIKVELANG